METAYDETSRHNQKTIKDYKNAREWVENEWLLPYLAIGGTRSDFWKLAPHDLEIDFKAYAMRQKANAQQAWLQGVYFKSALQSSILCCTLADRKVANSMPKFAEMPYKEEVEKTQEQDQEYLKAQREKAYMYFTALLSKKHSK